MNVWKHEELFFDGDAYFSRILKDIHDARRSVDFETYIYRNDALGKRLAAAFGEAAQRGVQVRVIVDGFGSPLWERDFLPTLAERGVEGKVFRPLPRFLLAYFFTKAFLSLKSTVKLFRRMNQRNHRKTCLIDGKIAYVGSFNVSAEHLNEFFGRYAWRDTGVRVEGGPLHEVQVSFLRIWRRASRKLRLRDLRWKSLKRKYYARVLAHGLQKWVQIKDKRRSRKAYYRNLLLRIASASTRVWIANPYFVPDRGLLRALQYASWAGVDVRILVPRKNDVYFMRWVSSAFYYGLLQAGVRVFEYTPSVLHAKTVLIDHWATVGSSNLNFRSLIHDQEIDVVLSKSESLQQLQESYLEDLTKSRELFYSDWISRSFFEKLLGRIFLIFRYWL